MKHKKYRQFYRQVKYKAKIVKSPIGRKQKGHSFPSDPNTQALKLKKIEYSFLKRGN